MLLFCFFVLGLNVDFQLDRDSNSIPYVIASYRMSYSDLIFYKKDSIYVSEYLVSLVVEEDGYQIRGKSKKHQLLANNYDETLSSNMYFNGFVEVEIPEGNIELTLTISDHNSSRSWSRTKKLEVSELKPTDIASVRWLSNPSREVITDGDTIKIRLNIFSAEKGKTQLKFYFKNEEGEVSFQRDTLLPDKKNQVLKVIVPANRFKEGLYEFTAEVQNFAGSKIAKKFISFRVWKPFFESSRFVDRVKQIEYIASSQEIKEMLSAKVEEREKLWNDFWERKDPTPGDNLNEFKIEYFDRIDFANRNFSRGSLFEGWRTDRGKVYIILGPPDNIVDEPFNPSGSAYQIWYYYEEGYNLIFIQRYMTGDYYLENPPPEIW
jgi:GWxTD domain-containing protein